MNKTSAGWKISRIRQDARLLRDRSSPPSRTCFLNLPSCGIVPLECLLLVLRVYAPYKLKLSKRFKLSLRFSSMLANIPRRTYLEALELAAVYHNTDSPVVTTSSLHPKTTAGLLYLWTERSPCGSHTRSSTASSMHATGPAHE